jgi:aryl-alcohol dehydrogenase-like predicted oxidoreductase
MNATMRYKLLGHSGLRVSEMCLGTMTFGETWGWGASLEESRKMLELFAEAGGNFIDTAVNYTGGSSEEILGELLQGRRDHFVVASKYTLTRHDDADPNGGGNSRKNMMKSVERSLRRLKTEALDLYYLHMWDYMTPVEEVARGMDDLVRQGKVQYLGFSDTPDWIVAEGNTRAELMGWSRFVAMQAPYSLMDRGVERAIMPAARHWDMAFLAWGLLEEGLLSGKFTGKVSEPTRLEPGQMRLSERTQRILDEAGKVAVETGRPMAQVAINWVRQQQRKGQVIPILGARRVEQLEQNLAALEWELTPEQLQRLDEAGAIDMGFPHGFLEGNRNIFGATREKIDSHWA